MGCKWATGPIIHTRAFRSLIHAKDNELVAGLLMIGIPDPKHIERMEKAGRKFKRALEGDVLQIL